MPAALDESASPGLVNVREFGAENAHLYQFWQKGDDSSPQEAFPLTFSQGQAYIVGRVDTLQFLNCFAIGYNVGFWFTSASPAGVTRARPSADIAKQIKDIGYSAGSAVVTGGGIDVSETAVLVDDSYVAAGLSFVNCSFSGFVRIRSTNHGMVHFTSCNIVAWQKSEDPIIESAGWGPLSLCNCIISDGASGYKKIKRAVV